MRDVVRAYWLLLHHGDAGNVYNIGRGQQSSVRSLLDQLLSLSSSNVEIVIDPTRLRPSDVPMSVCDNRRLVAATGWQPNFSLLQTLRDLLNYWRVQIETKKN